MACGHSIGEFVAAHIAGVFSLEEALRLVTVRGNLISELPGGSMLSVRATADELAKVLPDTVSIAAINSDKLCVVSGTYKEIEDFVLNDRIEGAKNFKVNSTPTIIINNKKFDKSLNYKNLKKTLEKLI